MSPSMGPDGGPLHVTEHQAGKDGRSPKRAVVVRDLYYAVALLVSIGITVHVFQNVPLDTVLPGSGRRGSSGHRVPFVMCMPPVVAVMFWRVFRRRPLSRGKYALVRKYVLAAVIPVLLVICQLVTAQALFEAAA